MFRYQASIPMKFMYLHKCIGLFWDERRDDYFNDSYSDFQIERLKVENSDDDITVSTVNIFLCNHLFFLNLHVCSVPTRTGKPGKLGRHFPVREKSGNFEQTGKVREKSGKITQNTGKLRKFEINIIWYFYILFLVIFKWTVYCLQKCIKFSVNNTKH